MNNPYAKYIEGREPIPVLRNTISRIKSVAEKILPAQGNTPWAPGKWTVAQVLTHLAQCEMMFGTRYRQALTKDDYTIQTFDQDKWLDWELSLDSGAALDAFIAIRTMNVSMLEKLSPAELNREFTHPDLGQGRIAEMLQVSAGHDLNHLEQLEAFAASVT